MAKELECRWQDGTVRHGCYGDETFVRCGHVNQRDMGVTPAFCHGKRCRYKNDPNGAGEAHPMPVPTLGRPK